MKKIFALFIVAAVIASSCKDDDPKLTVEQYLTAASNGWVYQSIIVSVGGQPIDVVQDPDEFGACDLDDAIIFTADGKYTVANTVKCDDDEDDILDSGVWTLNTDKTTLSLTSNIEGPFLVLTKLTVDDTNIKGEISSFYDLPITAQITMKKK